MTTAPAERMLVDVDAVALPAFGLEDEYGPLETDLHAHNKHQLLYSKHGTLELEVSGSRWLLPPQRAAWIGASTPHLVRALTPVALRTVYLAPAFRYVPEDACVVFAATPLLREMILHAMRWGPDRRREDERARLFFAALASLCGEWAADRLPFCLPAARSPELGRAMAYAMAELSGRPTIEEAAKRAGLSTRTLARRFSDEAHTSFRAFVHHARMMRAMELLSVEGARVTETALDVGFESPGAFTRAFEDFTGEKPKEYRRRRAAP